MVWISVVWVFGSSSSSNYLEPNWNQDPILELGGNQPPFLVLFILEQLDPSPVPKWHPISENQDQNLIPWKFWKLKPNQRFFLKPKNRTTLLVWLYM
jgi:hypothetical protein